MLVCSGINMAEAWRYVNSITCRLVLRYDINELSVLFSLSIALMTTASNVMQAHWEENNIIARARRPHSPQSLTKNSLPIQEQGKHKFRTGLVKFKLLYILWQMHSNQDKWVTEGLFQPASGFDLWLLLVTLIQTQVMQPLEQGP